MKYDPPDRETSRKSVTSAERIRLVNILGMLGSDHDGERAAAGLKATQMVRGKGMTWDDLIASLDKLAEPTTRSTEEAGFRPDADWPSRVTACLKYRALLNDWERQFLADLQRFRRLSYKQKAALEMIVAKVRAARWAAR